MRLFAVDDNERAIAQIDGNELSFERFAIKQNRMPLLAASRSVLVHDTAIYAYVFAFGFLRKQSHLYRVDRLPRHSSKRRYRRNLDRRRGRKTAAEGNGTLVQHIATDDLFACPLPHERATRRIICVFYVSVIFEPTDIERDLIGQIGPA